MLIYNTTYHTENEAIASEFVAWLKSEYIPRATKSGQLTLPQLAKVMASNQEGQSFALQFHVHSLDALEAWYRATGAALVDSMAHDFGQKVVGFSTLMELLD